MSSTDKIDTQNIERELDFQLFPHLICFLFQCIMMLSIFLFLQHPDSSTFSMDDLMKKLETLGRVHIWIIIIYSFNFQLQTIISGFSCMLLLRLMP